MGRADEGGLMASRILRDAADVDAFVRLLCAVKLPVTVTWEQGADRSHEQNALMWIWAGEVAAQLGDREAADVQAEWKLTIGIPILRADDPGFREKYDKTVRHLSYADKIVVMRDLDFPVTRLMRARQMCRFLDKVERKCVEMGLTLTQPPDDLADYNRRYGRAA